MHNASTSMEGPTSLNLYRYVSRLVACACRLRLSDFGIINRF
jgi:hypothetical protein